MSGWTKTKAIEWFTRRAGKAVVLGQAGTPLRVAGGLRSATEVDACSADYVTAAISTEAAGMQVEVSFHDDGVSIHLLAAPRAGGPHDISLAVAIPYASLELSEAAHGARRVGEEEQPPPGCYPYELLH